jgi:hypothetical protein
MGGVLARRNAFCKEALLQAAQLDQEVGVSLATDA